MSHISNGTRSGKASEGGYGNLEEDVFTSFGGPGKMHGPGGIQSGPQRMDNIPAASSTEWADDFRKRMGLKQVVTT